MSTAINMFLCEAVRERRLPLSLSLDTPNAVTKATIESSEKGENLHGPYDSVNDLMENLDN